MSFYLRPCRAPLDVPLEGGFDEQSGPLSLHHSPPLHTGHLHRIYTKMERNVCSEIRHKASKMQEHPSWQDSLLWHASTASHLPQLFCFYILNGGLTWLLRFLNHTTESTAELHFCGCSVSGPGDERETGCGNIGILDRQRLAWWEQIIHTLKYIQGHSWHVGHNYMSKSANLETQKYNREIPPFWGTKNKKSARPMIYRADTFSWTLSLSSLHVNIQMFQ